MPSTTVNRGNVLATIVVQATLTPAGVATVSSSEQTFTVPGLQVGDQISGVFYQGAWTVMVDIVNLRVSAANTLGISFQNSTGGTVTPPSGSYLIEVNRPEFLATNAY